MPLIKGIQFNSGKVLISIMSHLIPLVDQGLLKIQKAKLWLQGNYCTDIGGQVTHLLQGGIALPMLACLNISNSTGLILVAAPIPSYDNKKYL